MKPKRCEQGKLCLTPGANIVKLPNVSASIPQLYEAVKELQAQVPPPAPHSSTFLKRYTDLHALPGRDCGIPRCLKCACTPAHEQT